jgi:hypothetical protein
MEGNRKLELIFAHYLVGFDQIHLKNEDYKNLKSSFFRIMNKSGIIKYSLLNWVSDFFAYRKSNRRKANVQSVR